MSGKGDKRRPGDNKAYRNRYGRIFTTSDKLDKLYRQSCRLSTKIDELNNKRTSINDTIDELILTKCFDLGLLKLKWEYRTIQDFVEYHDLVAIENKQIIKSIYELFKKYNRNKIRFNKKVDLCINDMTGFVYLCTYLSKHFLDVVDKYHLSITNFADIEKYIPNT